MITEMTKEDRFFARKSKIEKIVNKTGWRFNHSIEWNDHTISFFFIDGEMLISLCYKEGHLIKMATEKLEGGC